MGRFWKAVSAITLLALAYAFWDLYREKQKRQELEMSIALESSRMINSRFQRMNELTVSRLIGDVVTHQECRGRLFNPEQRTKAPAFVEYKLSLKDIDRSAYEWNTKAKRLSITIPPVIIGRPNVDFTKQVVRQSGVFVSRECGLILQRKTAEALAAAASYEAGKPKHMAMAREAARAAVLDLATGILQGAGMANVQVSVVLSRETPRNPDGERWDETRPLAEVLSQ